MALVLQIPAFRDRGGLPREGRDRDQHKQFTRSLVLNCEREARGRFALQEANGAESVYVLEGELSRTETGKHEGAYLCIARLREKQSKKIVAQWAGSAKNLRYLYSNLTNTLGLSEFGLVGELTKQVILTLEILASESIPAPNPPAPTLPAGEIVSPVSLLRL